MLGDKQDVLRRTEDSLQREMLSRSSLETRKLELLSEISGLKLRQATLEKENLELRRHLHVQVQQQQQVPTGDQAIMTMPHQRKSYGGPDSRGVITTFKLCIKYYITLHKVVRVKVELRQVGRWFFTRVSSHLMNEGELFQSKNMNRVSTQLTEI